MNKNARPRASRNTSQRKAGKSLSSYNGSRCISQRDAHIVTRIPFGTGLLALNGSGNVTTVGGFAVSGSSAFTLRMANLGWLADLAAHFAYWKLHRASLVYTPGYHVVTNSVGLASAGVALFGFTDDPFETGNNNIQELRSAGEFELDRKWHLDYVPTSRGKEWLFIDSGASALASGTTRQTSAGNLVANSTIATTTLLYSAASMGRLELIVEVSFKGAAPYSVPTLDLRAVGEEKKESSAESKTESKTVSTDTEWVRVSTSRAGPVVMPLDRVSAADEYEFRALKTVPLRRAGAGPC